MAHFAKLGINGKVIAVHAVNDSDTLNADGVEDESIGQQFLERLHGWPQSMWIQTSCNTRAGKHYTITVDAEGIQTSSESVDQSKALRGKYAGIGMFYDEDNDIFKTKQPYASWTLNTTTSNWEAPTPMPSTETDGEPDLYNWNESTKAWDKDVL